LRESETVLLREGETESTIVSCCICCDDFLPKQMYAYKNCGHRYCKECLSQYYITCIDKGEVLHITCPDPKCTTEVLPHEIRQLIKPDLFLKYENLTLMTALRQDPNVRWCPKPNCNNCIIGDIPENLRVGEWRKIKCPDSNCGTEFCYDCGVEWHYGLTCTEKKTLDKKEKKPPTEENFQKWANKHTKPCPRCKANIQKNKGCNHMTCVNCQYEFCWLCLREYKPGHFSENNKDGCAGKQFTGAEKVKMYAITGLIGTVVILIGVPAFVTPIGPTLYSAYKLRKLWRERRNRVRFST